LSFLILVLIGLRLPVCNGPSNKLLTLLYVLFKVTFAVIIVVVLDFIYLIVII